MCYGDTQGCKISSVVWIVGNNATGEGSIVAEVNFIAACTRDLVFGIHHSFNRPEATSTPLFNHLLYPAYYVESSRDEIRLIDQA